MSCLTDENLPALVDGSADAEQLATWKAHISTCDACATRFARRQVGSPEPEPEPGSTIDPDATITVKLVGKPNLDAKAGQPPADAIPGYRIHKRENELRHDGYPFFMVLPA